MGSGTSKEKGDKIDLEGTVLNVCISEKKGTFKQAVESCLLIENFGFENDAHAGAGHRQVSLLDETEIETMRAKGLKLSPGAFGENIVTSGISLDSLGIGTRLQMGETEIELTQIGKVCHLRCAIYYQAGDCIMPRSGLFAKVIKGGIIKPGDKIKARAMVKRDVLQAAVLTVSDTCSTGVAINTAGPAVSELLKDKLSAHVGWTGIVPDESEQISERLKSLGERGIDLLLTVGGTGCTARDVTPQATKKVIEKELPGLAEAMRIASSEVTRHALLQRGVCGIFRSTLIINLPGSRKAAVENLQAVIDVIPHAVRLLRGDTVHSDDRISGETTSVV